MRGYRRAWKGEDREEARRQREDRYLEMYPDDDGMVVIRGRLPREVAAILEKALEAAMVAMREEESPSLSVIPAQAGITQLRGLLTSSDVSAETSLREDFGQRRVDALALLAEAALDKGLGQTERREPYQVMFHVDSAVFADRSDDGICELGTGDGISAETCRRLACDAPHVTVGAEVLTTLQPVADEYSVWTCLILKAVPIFTSTRQIADAA